MVGFRQLFLVALAATSVIAADATSVLNKLKIVDSQTKNITTDVNAYTGTGIQTLNLRTKITNLKKYINDTTNEVNAAPVPSVADGQTIQNYVNNPLFPDTNSSLTATRNKKATFTSAGIKNEIVQNLKDLKTATEALADKLIAKAPTTALKSSGQTSKTNFSNAFSSAITFMSA